MNIHDIRTLIARGEPFFHRERLGDFAFTYAMLPPWHLWEGETVSSPFAIDFAFLPTEPAVIARANGRIEERRVPAMSGGAVGAEEIRWLRTQGTCELVELRPDAALRRDVADAYGRAPAEAWAETDGHDDPFLVATAARLRSHALGGVPLGDLEADLLARRAIAGTVEREVGRRSRPQGRLDAKRLARVDAFMRENLASRITVAAIASVAAVSRHHFDVLFNRTVGVSAHAYLSTLRMERARRMLEAGHTVAEAARAVGYRPAHQFRQMFRQAFGVQPGAFRKRL